MFFGRYEHTLDEKNRLVIPFKMRSEAGEVLYLMKGYDGALSLYKESDFTKLMEEVSTYSFQKRNNRDYIRTQMSSTYDLEVDKLGRITIPTALINRYGIGKEVYIIGVVDHIEIWDKAKYLEYEKNSDENFEKVAEKLSENE
ncbi:MAG: division/cell wall cluster transcriptional repressor MraZ [Coprobacillus sp.]|nr:division/cell wall cluster transcriptional repressor MraZ [Coprobacillus sp.]